MARPRAKRMSPEARRQNIVDAAVDLLLKTGNSNCSLEQIAAHAGISKPLIYRYFSKREDLLQEILDREYAALQGRGLNSNPPDMPVEQVMRNTVKRALHYYHDHGPILRILSGDPDVSNLARKKNRESRSGATDYFIDRMTHDYGFSREVATIAVTMVVNAPIHSMSYLRHKDIDLDTTIEVWAEFVVGGWRALAREFGRDRSTTGKTRLDTGS